MEGDGAVSWEILRKKLAFLLFLVLVMNFLLLQWSTKQPSFVSHEVSEGVLYCFEDDTAYLSDLTEFCERDGFLYVLYGRKGILQVYDYDGNYLRSYGFSNYSHGSDLRVSGQKVLLRDTNGNHFCFSEGQPSTYYEYGYTHWDELDIHFEGYDEIHKSGDSTYYEKLACIYRESADGTHEKVLSRWIYYALYDGITPWITHVLCMIVIFALAFERKKSYV